MSVTLTQFHHACRLLALLLTAIAWNALQTIASGQDPGLSPNNADVVPQAAASPQQVSVGSSSVLLCDQVIEGIDVVDRAVCNVRQIRGGVIIQGLTFGKTRVTLWGEVLGITTFDVVVLPDRTEVLARLLQKYPRSGLRLIPAPETGKMVVEGILPSAWAIKDVLEQLEGPDLTRAQILSRLAYRCSSASNSAISASVCQPVRCVRR
jgi:hypothetical protein